MSQYGPLQYKVSAQRSQHQKYPYSPLLNTKVCECERNAPGRQLLGDVKRLQETIREPNANVYDGCALATMKGHANLVPRGARIEVRVLARGCVLDRLETCGNKKTSAELYTTMKFK